MQLKVIIVDDEFPARNYLSNLLKLLYPSKVIVLDKCDSVKTAVVSIQKNKPNLVFLDIQMPDESGLELFNYFDNLNFQVIFTTAHRDFAFDALKLGALDYLLKPVTVSDVKAAITRFELKFNTSIGIDNLPFIFEQIPDNKKLIISTKKGFEVLTITEIMYCKAEESYTYFHTKTSIVLASKAVKDACVNLHEPTFVRVHKSYIVNVNFIKSFKTCDFSLEMTDGAIIPVSDKSFTKKRLMDAIAR